MASAPTTTTTVAERSGDPLRIVEQGLSAVAAERAAQDLKASTK